MSKKITLTRAKNLLQVVALKNSFWLCTNQNLRSLNTLATSLDEVNDDVFRYHVNKYKNDFSAWVRDVIGDNDFAREISRIKTKDTLVRKITEKVVESRNVVSKYKDIAKKRKKVVKKKVKKPKKKPKRVKKPRKSVKKPKKTRKRKPKKKITRKPKRKPVRKKPKRARKITRSRTKKKKR